MASSVPPGSSSSAILASVEAVVALIRPSIQLDGGDVQVISVERGVVRLRFLGACIGCPSRLHTLRGGILKALQERVPGIVDIEEVST
ncbi:MAG: NifU family protein [Planctomycetota bacterium]|nr:NifU family protein [Planctomycetota bacterium]